MRLYKKVSESRETFKVRDFVNTSPHLEGFFKLNLTQKPILNPVAVHGKDMVF